MLAKKCIHLFMCAAEFPVQLYLLTQDTSLRHLIEALIHSYRPYASWLAVRCATWIDQSAGAMYVPACQTIYAEAQVFVWSQNWSSGSACQVVKVAVESVSIQLLLKTTCYFYLTGATKRMNLCQALTSAMDIAMEKDSSAGLINLCYVCM